MSYPPQIERHFPPAWVTNYACKYVNIHTYMHTYTHNRRKITTFYGNMQIFFEKNEFFLRNLPELTEINRFLRGARRIIGY